MDGPEDETKHLAPKSQRQVRNAKTVLRRLDYAFLWSPLPAIFLFLATSTEFGGFSITLLYAAILSVVAIAPLGAIIVLANLGPSRDK